VPTTPTWLLPYPQLSDTPDVPRDMQALATRLDLVGPIGRGAALPAAPIDGQVFEWVIDDAQGIQWLMRYNAAAPTYKWEYVGGPAKQERSDAEAGGGTIPAFTASGPPITIPKSGLWAFHFGGQLFVGSGPSGIGGIHLGLLVAGAQVGHAVYAQIPAGVASEHGGVEQRTIAKGVTVTLGTALNNASTGSTQFRWLRWHPLRVAND